MTIPIRLEKLRHMIKEMQLALFLAHNATDNFSARTTARHVLVRSENFIEHARAVRKPLRQAGMKVQTFHNSKEIFAKNFEEYFKIPRDKLSAHLQDFDFGKRIELWNSIEAIKVSYFVDGAIELYEQIGKLGCANFIAYTESPELLSSSAQDKLFKNINSSCGVELGDDPLAITRPNTVVMLNLTPIHSRAGQLSLLRKWIKSEIDLLTELDGFKDLSRIIKSRLITDIVSFCDCLVTRALPVGAPQSMDGLDLLLRQQKDSNSVIADFVRVSDFNTRLNEIRRIRDQAGAHIEIDTSVTLSDILAGLDALDLNECIDFYDRVCATFEKTCYSILYLRTYSRGSIRVNGISINARDEAQVPFHNKVESPTPHQPPPDYNSDYSSKLELWLHGDEDSSESARHFFFQAFMSSDKIEDIVEQENFEGGSFHRSNYEYRKAHQFIETALGQRQYRNSVPDILKLLVNCRSGNPYPLCEIIIRFTHTNRGKYDALAAFCLGEIATLPHSNVELFLREILEESLGWYVDFHAVLALFKIFTKSEGLLRANKRPSELKYADSILNLTARFFDTAKLLCYMAFASQFVSGNSLTFPEYFRTEHITLKNEIRKIIKSHELNKIFALAEDKLFLLLENDDYVGLCVTLADQFSTSQKMEISKILLTAGCTGLIAAAPHDGATRNLAVCFHRNGEYAIALQTAKDLARRNPDQIDYQIFVAQILTDSPGQQANAKSKIEEIRRRYSLNSSQENTLTEAEQLLKAS